jgi:hypothetical protein
MKLLLSGMLISWLWVGAFAQSGEADQGHRKQKVEIILAKKKQSNKAGDDKRSGSSHPEGNRRHAEQ